MIFFRGELEDRGRDLRERKKRALEEFWRIFFERDSEENCRHRDHFSGWNF